MYCRSVAVSLALLSIAPAGGASARSAQESSVQAAPTACDVRLSSDLAVFKTIGDLAGKPDGPAGCGGPDVVLLQRIILPDHSEVAVEPPATLRCEMAEAVAEFARQDLAPAAAAMGSPLSAIENEDSYDCRGRNRVAGAKLSEHGRANALDIGSVRLKDGRVVRPTDTGAPLAFRAAMKEAACDRFTTVLGPGSDSYHEDHVHIDLIARRSGYRMCQWDLHDEPRYVLSEAGSEAGQPAATPAHVTAAAVLTDPVPLPRTRPFSASVLALTGPAGRGSVPLPRPRPFKAAKARIVVPPAESRHR